LRYRQRCSMCRWRAQSSADAGPVKGSREIEVWAGGGPGFQLHGSVFPVDEWDVGASYGWVLTNAHGTGFLRGRFAYALDVMPALFVIQPTRTVYGGGFDPFALQWIFKTRRNIAPFFEVSGGGVFATEPIPAADTSFNFELNAALGLHTIRGMFVWSVDVRWFHISNAGISSPDPGINTLQVRIGFGLFRRPK